MASNNLERRVKRLEGELAQLKERLDVPTGGVSSTVPWWERIVGTFANDPHYEKAMRLGRAYRQSSRPRKRPAREKTR